ncbi:MAG: hypothetical protein WD877_00240 [Candidatus Saccharimonadales bacterium]
MVQKPDKDPLALSPKEEARVHGALADITSPAEALGRTVGPGRARRIIGKEHGKLLLEGFAATEAQREAEEAARAKERTENTLRVIRESKLEEL